MKGQRGRPRNKEPIVKYPVFQKNLQSRMEQLDITRSEMAKKLGLTDGTFAHYWYGERPTPIAVLQSIAEILSVTMDWLTKDHSAEEKPPELPIKIEVPTSPIPLTAEQWKELEAKAKLWEVLKEYKPK